MAKEGEWIGEVSRDWDDTVFYAQYHPQLAAPLEVALASDSELRTVAPFLREIVKVAVPFDQGRPDAYGELGNTRFGGMPDLPPDLPYPRYPAMGEHGPTSYAYEFVGQIDLASVAPLQTFLPRTGRLLFFLSTVQDLQGDISLDYPVCLVLHNRTDSAALVSGRRLDLTDADFFERSSGNSPEAFAPPIAPTVSAPSFYSIHQNEGLFEPVLRRLGYDVAAFFEDGDDLFELIDDTFEPLLHAEAHYLGGYGQSLHEFPIAQAARAHGGEPADWQLLLTVRSRDSMRWGEDGGDLHFVIHKRDLARQDFSRVWVGVFEGLG